MRYGLRYLLRMYLRYLHGGHEVALCGDVEWE